MFRLGIHLFVLLCVAAVAGAQINRKADLGFSQDPGHKQYLFVSGVRFSVPRDFDTRKRKTLPGLVYLPHVEYKLGLFVALPTGPVSEGYLKSLATSVSANLFPKETATYSWKESKSGYEKVSKFETDGGMLMGFNGHRSLVVQFRQIKIKSKQLIVGYTFDLHRSSDEARKAFEENLGGDSMTGWYAQAHILASLTGEKYEEINPGTELSAHLVTAPQPLAPAPSKPLDLGQLSGLDYTNEFFGLSLLLPQQWIVTSAQRRDQIATDAKKMVLAGEKSKTQQVHDSIDRSTTLLALTKLPVGLPDNASFMLVAERIPSPDIKSGTDLLRTLERLAKGTNFTVDFVDGITSEQVNGIDMGVATIKNTSPYGVFWQKIYVTVKNGYALQLSFTYLNDADLPAFKEIVNSIKIN